MYGSLAASMRGLPARWSGTEGVTPLPGVPVCVRGSACAGYSSRERRDVRGLPVCYTVLQGCGAEV